MNRKRNRLYKYIVSIYIYWVVRVLLFIITYNGYPNETQTNPTISNPWYNDNCKEAIKQRKQALSKFKRSPNSNNLKDIKVFRAKASRTINFRNVSRGDLMFQKSIIRLEIH